MVVANTQTIRAVVVGRQSSVADRLTALGYDVVARVAAGREAIDVARRLAPDAVFFETELTDGLGVLAAQAVTRATPGVAALILSGHPAAANRDARPQWGPVSLMALDVAEAELDADVRDAIARARAFVVSPEIEEAPEIEEIGETAELYDLGAVVVDDEPVAGEESDEALIDRAIAAVSERTSLSPSEALRLMEQEADDNGQSLREVAVAMIGDEQG
jgi:AmiR/NasT family two-component response regulator